MKPLDELLEELERRRQKALAMGGARKLAQRKAEGILNARERMERLFDPGSFIESGMLAVSNRPEDKESTPADGKVSGFGRIDGREAAVIANDFTVKGASSASINIKKLKHMKAVARRRGIPIVFLGESTGARMPDVMGAGSIGSKDDPTEYQRVRESPWAAGVLGYCYGSSAWYASMSDFCVMRKGAIMAVSSPRLISMAIGKEVDGEALGGWRVHSEVKRHRGPGRQIPTSRRSTRSGSSCRICPATGWSPRRSIRCPKGSGTEMERVLDLIPGIGQPGLRREARDPLHRGSRLDVRAEGALRKGDRHRARPPRRQIRRASSPTTRSTAAARSAPTSARRCRASSCCATRSTFRSSCWSTSRAS
jgi:methylmalonyl-CoA decarboxylase subunit alpha